MAKTRYKSKHRGTARNTLCQPNHVPTPTPTTKGAKTPRIWSTRRFTPHPFSPHIFRRLTIAQGTTTNPTQARPMGSNTPKPPFNSPQASMMPIQNTPAVSDVHRLRAVRQPKRRHLPPFRAQERRRFRFRHATRHHVRQAVQLHAHGACHAELPCGPAVQHVAEHRERPDQGHHLDPARLGATRPFLLKPKHHVVGPSRHQRLAQKRPGRRGPTHHHPAQQIAKRQRVGNPFPCIHATKLTHPITRSSPALYASSLNLSPKNETFLNPLSYIRKPTVIFTCGKGPMAEWLGSALQKLLQRFESASDLID